MSKPRLFIFVGYPGAGKTSVAKLIAKRSGAAHLWADHIRKQMFEEPTHSREESSELYHHLNAETAKLLASGKSVIFDTNFNFYYDRELLRHIAEDNGAKTTLIWVTTGQELAQERAVRKSHNQHTRIYGNMTDQDFERIARNLQPPKAEEHPVKIDGSNLDQNLLYELLGI